MTSFVNKLTLFVLLFTLNNAWGANSVPQEEEPNFRALASYVRFSRDSEILHSALRAVPSETSEGLGDFIRSLIEHKSDVHCGTIAELIPLVCDIDPSYRSDFSACVSHLFKHANFSDDFEKIVSGFKTIPPTYWASLREVAEGIGARRHVWAKDISEEIRAYTVSDDGTGSSHPPFSPDLLRNLDALSAYASSSHDRPSLIRALRGSPPGIGNCIRTLLEARRDRHARISEVINLIPLVSDIEQEHQETFLAAATPLFKHATFERDAISIIEALLAIPRDHLRSFREVAEGIGARDHVWADDIAEEIRAYTVPDDGTESGHPPFSPDLLSNLKALSTYARSSDDIPSLIRALRGFPPGIGNCIRTLLEARRGRHARISEVINLIPLVSVIEEEHQEKFLAAATPLFKHVTFERDAIGIIKALLKMPRDHLTSFRQVAEDIGARGHVRAEDIVNEIRAYTVPDAASENLEQGSASSASSASSTAAEAPEVPSEMSRGGVASSASSTAAEAPEVPSEMSRGGVASSASSAAAETPEVPSEMSRGGVASSASSAAAETPEVPSEMSRGGHYPFSPDLLSNLNALSTYARSSDDISSLIRALRGSPPGIGNCIRTLLEARGNGRAWMSEVINLIPLVSGIEQEHQEKFLAAATPLLKHAPFEEGAIRIVKALLEMPRDHLTGFRQVAENIGARRHVWEEAIVKEIRSYRPTDSTSERSEQGSASSASSASSAAAETPETSGEATPTARAQLDSIVQQVVNRFYRNLILMGGNVHVQVQDDGSLVFLPIHPTGVLLERGIILYRPGGEAPDEDETPDKETAIQNILKSQPHFKDLHDSGLLIDGKQIATGDEVLNELILSIRLDKEVADYLKSQDFKKDFKERKEGQTWIDVLNEHF